MLHDRYIRDFLLNLDNFHDYLKFTFPRMKAPSFFVENETEQSNCFPRVLAHICPIAKTVFRHYASVPEQEERVSLLRPRAGNIES